EHLTTDQKVRGSNPFGRTKQTRTDKVRVFLSARLVDGFPALMRAVLALPALMSMSYSLVARL
ncbi:hypothetical protein, partial [uncultured Corynebacterium sp.]|uniref:hypothetical protein n=1 Tax=uncultured Corynebacterium sp. TaxID=159447 RepID=UPI0025994E8F